MAGPVDEVESIEVIDDRTLIFHFYEPYAAWQELMWMGICSKRYYDRVGPDKFRKHPVGSGVYKFVSRRIGESIKLEVNRNYWDKKVSLPNFKYLEFVIVNDDQTRQAMLETGELDIVYDLLPHQLKRLKLNKRVKIKRCSNVPSMFALAGKVYADPIMRDRNFTHAVQCAINRQEIVDKIFMGEGYPLYMFASRSELGYDPEIKFEFNQEKAKEYLKKSSYKPGYPIMVTYTSGVPNAALVAAAVQQYMQAIGITTQIRQLEAGTEATYTRNRDPRIGAYVLYAWAGGRDPSTRLMLTLKNTSPYSSYDDRPRQKELNELVDAQAAELDVKRRLELLSRLHELMMEDGDSVSLYGLNMIYATSDRVGYSWTPEESFPINLDTIRVVK
jgi:peptide/nickel transport system substrate-binding protein